MCYFAANGSYEMVNGLILVVSSPPLGSCVARHDVNEDVEPGNEPTAVHCQAQHFKSNAAAAHKRRRFFVGFISCIVPHRSDVQSVDSQDTVLVPGVHCCVLILRSICARVLLLSVRFVVSGS